MLRKISSTLFTILTLLCVMVLSLSLYIPVEAKTFPVNRNQNNCVSCHEDLYFLHDTGKWFCLRESPMDCVDCHGGDPEAITQDTAHLRREAHPVINDDISKCQECHSEDCEERVETFDQTAGISQILVARPLAPTNLPNPDGVVTVTMPEQNPNRFLPFWEIIPLTLVSGLVLIIYFVARRRHH